jgi:hypothetical protein
MKAKMGEIAQSYIASTAQRQETKTQISLISKLKNIKCYI